MPCSARTRTLVSLACSPGRASVASRPFRLSNSNSQSAATRATVARALREILPRDTQVLTRDELAANEVAFWTTKTGTGLIFGSGLIVL